VLLGLGVGHAKEKAMVTARTFTEQKNAVVDDFVTVHVGAAAEQTNDRGIAAVL